MRLELLEQSSRREETKLTCYAEGSSSLGTKQHGERTFRLHHSKTAERVLCNIKFLELYHNSVFYFPLVQVNFFLDLDSLGMTSGCQEGNRT